MTGVEVEQWRQIVRGKNERIDQLMAELASEKEAHAAERVRADALAAAASAWYNLSPVDYASAGAAALRSAVRAVLDSRARTGS